jgi:hypothetical protein
MVGGNPVTLLSIDPGKRIGWAVFANNGTEIGRGVLDFERFAHSLNYRPGVSYDRLIFTPRGVEGKDHHMDNGTLKIRDLTYESFYSDPGVKQGGSIGEAQEVIGVLKYLCLQAGIIPHAQRAALVVGQDSPAVRLTGYEYPLTSTGNEKHLPDEDAAWLHGMYRLIDTGVIRPPHDVRDTL